jgi:hypothetical protein
MMLLKSVDELADIVAAFDAAKAFLSEEQAGGSPTQHHGSSASVSRGWCKIGCGQNSSQSNSSNDDLVIHFRKVAECRNGKPSFVAEPVPEWLRALL